MRVQPVPPIYRLSPDPSPHSQEARPRTRATVGEVMEAIRRANYNHTGESLEGLLERLGWTVDEYKRALVLEGSEKK